VVLVVLNANDLLQQNRLELGSSGTLCPTDPDDADDPHEIEYEIGQSDGDERHLRISYERDDSGRRFQVIRLQPSIPHFGGVRWWLTCPQILPGGIPCGRRAGKLYFCDGEFACRHCHDLTYASSVVSH
jgi:hypothetical protein